MDKLSSFEHSTLLCPEIISYFPFSIFLTIIGTKTPFSLILSKTSCFLISSYIEKGCLFLKATNLLNSIFIILLVFSTFCSSTFFVNSGVLSTTNFFLASSILKINPPIQVLYQIQ